MWNRPIAKRDRKTKKPKPFRSFLLLFPAIRQPIRGRWRWRNCLSFLFFLRYEHCRSIIYPSRRVNQSIQMLCLGYRFESKHTHAHTRAHTHIRAMEQKKKEFFHEKANECRKSVEEERESKRQESLQDEKYTPSVCMCVCVENVG